MRKKTLNNQGVALVTVVLFFLVLVILLGGVMFSSITNQGNAVLSKEHSSAYYVAESGLNVTIEKLKAFLVAGAYGKIPVGQYIKKMADLKTFIDGLNGTSTTLSLGTFTISTDTSSNPYTLRSTGSVDGTTRTVQTSFKITPILEDLMKAVYAKNSVSIGNPNNQIEGSVASLMLNGGPFGVIQDCSIDIIYVPENYIDDVKFDEKLVCNPPIDVIAIPEPEKIVFAEFALPTPPSTTVVTMPNPINSLNLDNWSATTRYDVVRFPGLSNSLRNLVINLGDGDSSRVFHLTLADSASLRYTNVEVRGDGTLMLYTTVNSTDTTESGNKDKVTFTYELNGTIIPDTTKPENLSKIQLILKKGSGYTHDKNPIFTTKGTFVGTILADDFDLFFQNGNIKGFIGTSLGDNVTVMANTSILGPMWIYAPNAFVNLNSGAYLEGAIIAENVSFSSGADLTFKNYTGGIPQSVTLPLFKFGEPVEVGITVEFINFKEV